MYDYVIFTDTGCDILPEKLREWDVMNIDLTFRVDGETREYTQAEIPTKRFYDNMRAGTVYRTAAANAETITNALTPPLEAGSDVLYVAFGSGLSSTANTAKLVGEELRAKFPERKIIVVDSLCASAGHGLLLWFAVEARREGRTIEEAEAVVMKNLPGLCHWFTVDDLVYLKRGGRVSAAAAFFGGMLNIKPVLHVDDAGHLIPMSKVRGRNASIKALAKKYTETAIDPGHCTYFISHGDCPEDAKKLEQIIIDEHGNHAALITEIGPVIGAHSGPGTLAVFFVGTRR